MQGSIHLPTAFGTYLVDESRVVDALQLEGGAEDRLGRHLGVMTPSGTKGQSSGKWCKGVGEGATSAWPWGTAGAPGGGQGQQGVGWAGWQLCC